MTIEQVVKIYKALGDTTRLQIVMHFQNGKSLCPSDLGHELNEIPSSTLSHHLRVLVECGLLIRQRSGTYLDYSLNCTIAQRFLTEIEIGD